MFQAADDEYDEDDPLGPMLRKRQRDQLVLNNASSLTSRPESFSLASVRGEIDKEKKDVPGSPNFFDSLREEPIPTGGIPVKLGHIGSWADQYTMAQFRNARADARTTSSAALHDMSQAVVKILLEVGSTVQQRVTEATHLAAKPTRKEVKAKKFELAEPAASGSSAKNEEMKRSQSLTEAKADKERFTSFVSLIEAILLKHVSLTDIESEALIYLRSYLCR